MENPKELQIETFNTIFYGRGRGIPFRVQRAGCARARQEPPGEDQDDCLQKSGNRRVSFQ